jgi:hypothetical protein
VATLALAGCTHPAALPYPAGLANAEALQGRSVVPGNVELHVEPSEARVEVDGVEVGLASDFDGSRGCLQLANGPHHLVLSKQGFLAADMTVYASDDGRQRLNLELVRSP